jgi:D-sedoheptulose 7-phosphate isomerase
MDHIEDHIRVLKEFKDINLKSLDQISKKIVDKIKKGKNILIFGNGGSSAEAQHFSGEILGRFENHNRRALNAICLTTDSATLTAVANDFGFEHVFARQIEGLAKPGDILFGISTSGKSKNILNGFKTGRLIGTYNILLTGEITKKKNSLVDHSISVPSKSTAIIQEIHLIIIHHICRALDKGFFNKK